MSFPETPTEQSRGEEENHLLPIKFYGSFDKPLGKYLEDDLFDQTSSCRTCKELFDSHNL
ncbi:hypothetical protein YC2023_011492 [Brassica napus]